MVNNNLPNQTDYLGTVPAVVVSIVIDAVLMVIDFAARQAKRHFEKSMEDCQKKCLPNECKSCCMTNGNAAIMSLTVVYMSQRGICLTLPPQLIPLCWGLALADFTIDIVDLNSSINACSKSCNP